MYPVLCLAILTHRITYCSPVRNLPRRSSPSGNSLGSNMMESESPPPASPPTSTDNTEVFSRGTLTGHGEVREAIKVVPEGNTSATENMGEPTPMETGDGGHAQFGPQPNIISETYTAPESGGQPPSKEGGASTPPVTSVNPEAPDTLVEAL